MPITVFDRSDRITSFVSDRSPPYGCQTAAISLTDQLEHIFMKRESVGLMVLSTDGEVLCINEKARDVILNNTNVDEYLADMRLQVLTSTTTRGSTKSPFSGFPKTPIIRLLISQGPTWYGLRGFWLEATLDSADPASSLIGAVIEQINLRRSDLYQAQRLYGLSPRETSVVTALAAGKTDKEIASALDVSPETVRWYLKSIRTKMEVSTRTGILHKMFFT